MKKINKKTVFFRGVLGLVCGGFLAACNDDGSAVDIDTPKGASLSVSHIVADNMTVKSIEIDVQGNKLIAGSFLGLMDFGSSQQPDVRDGGGTDDAYVVALNPQGDIVWHWSVASPEEYGQNNSSNFVRVADVALDSEGNVYIIGHFSGEMDFDPSENEDQQATPPRKTNTEPFRNNIFISKLSGMGAYLWTKTYAGNSFDYGFGITIDSNDDLYITGSFQSTDIDFDLSDTKVVNKEKLSGLSSLRNGADAFVSKLTKDGVEIWTQNYGGQTSWNGNKVYGYSAGHSIVLSDDGSKLILTGSVKSIIDFTPQDFAATGQHYTQGGSNIFVAQLDSSTGVYEWSYQIAAWSDDVDAGSVWGGENVASWLATNSDGEVFVTSYFKGDATFNFNDTSSTLSSDATPVATNDMFLTKLSALGLHEWTHVMGSDGDDRSEGIAIDSQGALYLTGRYGGAVDFDASAAEDVLTAVGVSDAFVTKVNADGSYVWTRTIESAAGATAFGRLIAIDGSRLISAGNLSSTADFDSGVGVEIKGSQGANSAYVSDWTLAIP